MRPRYYFGIFLIAAGSTLAFAGNTSQILKLTVPKVVLIDIDPAIPFSFTQGAKNASGNSLLSISSNDPQAKLQITPSGLNLAVTSEVLGCPTEASATTIICKVGVTRTKGAVLAFNATQIGSAPNIVYTISD
jgi:hypothetical protein